MGIIARAQKVKSIGAERGGGLVAVFGQDHLLDPMRGLFTKTPTSTKQPMMFRIMWCKNALASKSNRKVSMRVAGAFSVI
jgi:hypothetical protein